MHNSKESFHISLIPFQRLSDLDCSGTDPPNSTANKYHEAENEGGLLTLYHGTSYQTKYHQHAISHQARLFKVNFLIKKFMNAVIYGNVVQLFSNSLMLNVKYLQLNSSESQERL